MNGKSILKSFMDLVFSHCVPDLMPYTAGSQDLMSILFSEEEIIKEELH